MITGSVRHVILDRDGVLNREGDLPVAGPDDWTWERDAVDGLRALAALGCVVSVVTNQAAVGRGQLSGQAVDDLHRWLVRQLGDLGVEVVGVWACTHVPADGCDCRKPAPGSVLAAIEAAGVPAAATIMIGDDLTDLDAGRRAGIAVMLVRTGKGAACAGNVPADTPVVDDLCAAAAAIGGAQSAG